MTIGMQAQLTANQIYSKSVFKMTGLHFSIYSSTNFKLQKNYYVLLKLFEYISIPFKTQSKLKYIKQCLVNLDTTLKLLLFEKIGAIKFYMLACFARTRLFP